jgi:hypothetical protein
MALDVLPELVLLCGGIMLIIHVMKSGLTLLQFVLLFCLFMIASYVKRYLDSRNK